MKIVIYGAGGFGKDIHFLIDCLIACDAHIDFLGFYDDYKPKGAKVNGFEILGGLKELNSVSFKCGVMLGFGESQMRSEVMSKLFNPNIWYPNLIHPNSCIDLKTITLGQGNIINYGVIISRNTVIGDFNVFNSLVTIGHDVEIDSFNTFSPKVSISGSNKIGNECFFGVSSSTIQGIVVPNNVRLGAHSLLIKKPKSGYLYFGMPAIRQF